MRATLDKFLRRTKNKDIYFLHADMRSYDINKYPNALNCGIQEPTMVNIASGLASQGKKVIIYGVAGFVLYKAYEQIKLNVKGYAEKSGSVIFVNAGHNGCYSIAGRGHLVEDDYKLCDALEMDLFTPKDRHSFVKDLRDGLSNNGARFIRLGWDNEVWDKLKDENDRE